MNERFSMRRALAADLYRFRSVMAPGARLDWTIWLSLFSHRFIPILLCRLAHRLYLWRLGPLAKLASLINFLFYGIEISVRCPIGPGLIFPHTSGTVIGAASIGANATIYHSVTIGAKEVDNVFTEERRPVLGDDVLVGSGAKVLGGVTIGNGARVGANAIVVESLQPGALAVGPAARIIAPKA